VESSTPGSPTLTMKLWLWVRRRHDLLHLALDGPKIGARVDGHLHGLAGRDAADVRLPHHQYIAGRRSTPPAPAGGPGRQSPSSTRVLTTRPAKGARTTDSSATEAAACTAPRLGDRSLGALEVHARHVELEVGGGGVGVQRLVPPVVALGEREGSLGLGESSGRLSELAVAGRRLDLQELLTWLTREPASTQIAVTGPITRLDTKAWRPGWTCSNIDRLAFRDPSTTAVRTVTAVRAGAASSAWCRRRRRR